MSQPHPFQVLQEIGLSEKAATIYIALLNNRRMTIAQLARESGVKRATCYEYIDALLAKGFLLRQPVGKRIYYSAVNPHKILAELEALGEGATPAKVNKIIGNDSWTKEFCCNCHKHLRPSYRESEFSIQNLCSLKLF